MKKISWVTVCNLLLICFCLSCTQINDHNIKIRISESAQYYSLSALFNQERTRDVDEYMNHKIGKRNHMSFTNSKIDGQLTLDDHATFYMKKYPGHLEIKLDKDKNSIEAYHEIKTMCEGIKNVVTEQ